MLEFRDSGLPQRGAIPWGTHFCQFYESPEDLADILVPYFSAGLRANEACMWITSEPLQVHAARDCLQAALPDAERYLRTGQLEILSHREWYLHNGRFEAETVLQGWVERERRALERGFDGLRLTGNTFWLDRDDWGRFTDYEAAIDSMLGQHRMIALCTYCLDRCGAGDIIDVIKNHEFALIRRDGRWDMVESAARRRAVEALAETHAHYQQLFENMTEGFAVHRIVTEGGRPVDYVFLDVNPAFEKMTGLQRDRIIGRRVTQVLPGIEAGVFDWIGTYGRVAVTGERVQFEQRADFLDRWYSVSAYRPGEGQFATVFADITARKRAEAEREQLLVREIAARRQAEDALELRDRMLAIIGHDLRQPLTVISTSVQAMLRQAARSEEDVRLLTRAGRNARRMVSMIADLLDYARCRAHGSLPVAPRPVELEALLRAVVDDARAANPAAELVVETEGELTGNWDPDRLMQALVNLIGNALAYGEPGNAVVVSARARQHGVQLQVSNAGRRIPDHEQASLFEPFRRGISGAERSPAGLGLGLYIVREIVTAHGGSVAVESSDRCTMITAELPR
jgi:PAS domain S-box-containing protein